MSAGWIGSKDPRLACGFPASCAAPHLADLPAENTPMVNAQCGSSRLSQAAGLLPASVAAASGALLRVAAPKDLLSAWPWVNIQIVPSEHPNPTTQIQIGSKMGGEFTNPLKWDPIGFDQPHGVRGHWHRGHLRAPQSLTEGYETKPREGWKEQNSDQKGSLACIRIAYAETCGFVSKLVVSCWFLFTTTPKGVRSNKYIYRQQSTNSPSVFARYWPH